MGINELLVEELKRRLEAETDEGKAIESIKAEGKFAVEKKYDGFRACIHKKGDSIKIFSDQAKDITFPFPTAISQANALYKGNFIIDCEFVLHKGNKSLSRDIAVKYIEAVKSKKEIDDKGVVVYAFDCLYYDKDITNLPWHERKRLLHSMKFTDNIKEAASVIVTNKQEAMKAITMFRDMNGSRGVLVKRYSGKYSPNKESIDWIKYGREVEVKITESVAENPKIACNDSKRNILVNERGKPK